MDYQSKAEEYLRDKREFEKEKESRLTVKTLSDLDVMHPGLYTEICFNTAENIENIRLDAFRNVKSVHINSRCKGIPDLTAFHNIKELLIYIPAAPDVLEMISMESLEELHISLDPEFGNLSLSATNLKNLQIYFCGDAEESRSIGKIDFSKTPSVETLKLSHVNGVDISSIRSLTKLEKLNIESYSNGILDEIAACDNLRELYIRGKLDSLNGIERLKHLEKLEIQNDICAPLKQDDLDLLNTIPNLKYVEINKIDCNVHFNFREGIKTVITDRDHDYLRIERKAGEITKEAVDWILSDDIKSIDSVRQSMRETFLKERNMPFQDRLRQKIQQISIQKYWKINPYDLYMFREFDSTYIEKYMEFVQQIYPFVAFSEEIRQHFKYQKLLKFDNEDVADGFFYSAEKELYFIRSKVKLGKGRMEIRTLPGDYVKKDIEKAIIDEWSDVIQEPYDDLDIWLQVLPKYSTHVKVEEIIIPALISIYCSVQGIALGKGLGLAGEFKTDGTLKKKYPMRSCFLALKEAKADKLLVYGKESYYRKNVSSTEGFNLISVSSVSDIMEKLSAM